MGERIWESRYDDSPTDIYIDWRGNLGGHCQNVQSETYSRTASYETLTSDLHGHTLSLDINVVLQGLGDARRDNQYWSDCWQ